MCRTKMAINASEPNRQPSRSSRAAKSTEPPPRTPRSSRPSSDGGASFVPSSSSHPSTGSNATATANYTSTISFRDSSRTSQSSLASLSSLGLRDSLPETPNVYNFSEICAATNNFLAKKHSSSSAASWRCTLRGKDVIVFQRKFRRQMEKWQLKDRLSTIYRSHHVSIIKLLGASISGDNHIYLVYEFANGANLAACLRNPKNPNFTVLSTWISRMQVAADIAHGLDYIHNNTGLNTNLVHNHIKSSSIIVTEPSFSAKICHFGTAQLCGETDEPLPSSSAQSKGKNAEIVEKDDEEVKLSSPSPEFKRLDSRRMQFEGVRGYMSPEFQSTGIPTQNSDVYAFGVVILELLSGEEPLKYKYDKESGDFRRTSLIETATAVIGDTDNGGDGGGDGGEEREREREGRLRRWIDRRLKDSFPVVAAERVTRVALECVHVDPDKRPNMRRVVGKISKLYLESERWSKKIKMPTGISVSLGPR